MKGLAVAVGAFLLAVGTWFFVTRVPVVRFDVPGRGALALWQHGYTPEDWNWLLALALLLAALGLFLWRRWSAAPGPLVRSLAPLALLPLAAPVMATADLLPAEMASGALFFLPVVVLTMIARRALADPGHRGEGKDPGPKAAAVLVIAATLFWGWFGWYSSSHSREHLGDEGHYIMIARSLWYDGDLDIRNNWEAELRASLPEDQVAKRMTEPGQFHVSPNSRGGHWYSWHAIGLPLLLAPFAGLGAAFRAAVMGGLGALTCLGAYLTCRLLGIGPRAALTAVAGVAGGFIWAFYASRAYPEMLGGCLLVWAFWAALRREGRPFLANAVAAAACSYLPFAHHRFAALAPAALLFFVAMAGGRPRFSFPRALRRCAPALLACGLAWTIFLLLQFRLYEGGRIYAVEAALFSYKWGAWATLADTLGIASIMPAIFWLLAAAILAPFSRRAPASLRIYTAVGGVVFLGYTAIACSNLYYLWTTSAPGRYLVVVLPLLIPGAAWALDRAESTARGWFLFLCAVSTILLAMVVLFMPVLGKLFVMPVHGLWNAHPLLSSLFHPHASFYPVIPAGADAAAYLRPMRAIGLFSVYTTTFQRIAVSGYVLLATALTAVLMTLPAGRRRLAPACIAVMIVIAGAVHLSRPAELRREPRRLLQATLADDRRGPFFAVPRWSPGEAGRVNREDVERLVGR